MTLEDRIAKSSVQRFRAGRDLSDAPAVGREWPNEGWDAAKVPDWKIARPKTKKKK